MKFDQLNYSKGLYKCIPFQLVEDSIAKGYEKTLVYYIWMKALKPSPVYHNFSCRKLAKELKVSVFTITKHIPVMEKLGLIRFENGDLICTGTNAWLKNNKISYRSLVPIKIDLKNKSYQLNYLRYVVIHRNFSYQAKAIDQKLAVLKLSRPDVNLDSKQVKSLMRLRKRVEAKIPLRTKLVQTLRTNLIMSNNKFGKLTGLSKQGGQKLQKQLQELGMFESEAVYTATKISDFTPSMLDRLDLPACYRVSHTGLVVRQRANRIGLLSKVGIQKQTPCI